MMPIDASRTAMKKLTLSYLILLISTTMCANTIAQENTQMTENEQIVREFISAWSRLDAEELADYFTNDGIYHNIPSTEVQGRDNIQQFIAGFIRPWESTDWEIVSLLAEGDTVMVERLDKTVVAGSPVNLPCLGIFELEDGKIKMWRDYFDLATYTTALTQALENN
jgi:limonene-1,2-epoxide hydrolase